jgi:predicted dehydrogenase
MSPAMSARSTRRAFLQLSALAGATLLGSSCASLPGLAPRARKPVRGRLRHASIGVGGMGEADLGEISSHPEVEIVALCDVDRGFLEKAAARSPGARLYRDWRELLAREARHLHSVNVTTPDHMHAPITLAALELGLHVYCQKPLTRSVAEARAVRRAAARSGAVTQMGIQNHSNWPYGQALELFRAGHIGRVHEVHVWTDRPKGWWPQGVGRPADADAVPETLDWDLWLGVAPVRPFKTGQYHPFAWRGWKDFGTGAQGDMACHLMDPALWFLGLGEPLSVRSDGPPPNDETYPLWSRVHYEFPPNELTTRGPVLVTWYDGGKLPPRDVLDDLGAGEIYGNASLFLGEKGALIASPYETPRLLPAERFANVPLPEKKGVSHWHQWVDACRGVGSPSAPFEYSAFLTEVALLGNVALHFPHETLAWDARHMRFPGRPEADALLAPRYRAGWETRGLGSA